MDNAVALAAIALAGSIATGFFTLTNKLSKSIDKSVEAHKKVAATNKEIAKAVTKQAKESADRNGHIAALIIESRDNIIKANQHVKTQEVEHQHVNEQG